MPRLSVKASDASLCSAVILPLVKREDGRWVSCTRAPALVPVLCLGRRVTALEGRGTLKGTFLFAAAHPTAGGARLREIYLAPHYFEAAAESGSHKG